MFFENIGIARLLTVLRVRDIRQGTPAKNSAIPYLRADSRYEFGLDL
jgi:hypothetical protein